MYVYVFCEFRNFCSMSFEHDFLEPNFKALILHCHIMFMYQLLDCMLARILMYA